MVGASNPSGKLMPGNILCLNPSGVNRAANVFSMELVVVLLLVLLLVRLLVVLPSLDALLAAVRILSNKRTSSVTSLSNLSSYRPNPPPLKLLAVVFFFRVVAPDVLAVVVVALVVVVVVVVALVEVFLLALYSTMYARANFFARPFLGSSTSNCFKSCMAFLSCFNW